MVFWWKSNLAYILHWLMTQTWEVLEKEGIVSLYHSWKYKIKKPNYQHFKICLPQIVVSHCSQIQRSKLSLLPIKTEITLDFTFHPPPHTSPVSSSDVRSGDEGDWFLLYIWYSLFWISAHKYLYLKIYICLYGPRTGGGESYYGLLGFGCCVIGQSMTWTKKAGTKKQTNKAMQIKLTAE